MRSTSWAMTVGFISFRKVFMAFALSHFQATPYGYRSNSHTAISDAHKPHAHYQAVINAGNNRVSVAVRVITAVSGRVIRVGPLIARWRRDSTMGSHCNNKTLNYSLSPNAHVSLTHVNMHRCALNCIAITIAPLRTAVYIFNGNRLRRVDDFDGVLASEFTTPLYIE